MSIQNCLATYGCSSSVKKPIGADPPIGAIYTPYVKVTVGGQVLLMSGNNSSPVNPHHAMITSFQYGCQSGTGGCGATIEVIDEGGITYEKVYQALNKDITKTQDNTQGVPGCSVEFGWVVTNCEGVSNRFTNLSEPSFPGGGGGPIQLLPRKLNATFDGGLVKFILECTDLFSGRSADGRLENNIGTEDGKVALKPALQETFLQKDPKFASVNFYRSDGSTFNFTNKDGGKEGYFSVHNMDQETDIGCARKWVNNTLTDNDKGVLIIYNPNDGGVVFLEDPENNDGCCDKKRNVGTYIVNGGNESPVISFNPSFDWIIGSNSGSGGVASGATSAEGTEDKVKAKEKDGCKQNTGVQSQFLSSSNKFHWQHPDEQAFRTGVTFTEHSNATKSYEMVVPIEAELKILGDPRLVNPLFLTAKWISIVVIDPYYIKKDTSSGDSCSWLTESNCNPILSNKKWMIMGADHQLTSGSYVTTLKVKLAAPGVDTCAGAGLGDCGEPTNASATKPNK